MGWAGIYYVYDCMMVLQVARSRFIIKIQSNLQDAELVFFVNVENMVTLDGEN